jgi:hypothetical protein
VCEKGERTDLREREGEERGRMREGMERDERKFVRRKERGTLEKKEERELRGVELILGMKG